jgi:hypothetical protein
MYETGQSDPRDELRQALAQLEAALARHEREALGAGDVAGEPALQILKRSVRIMQQEADRLRSLLGA